MTSLAIFSFNQHWFHLGSLLEATIGNRHRYDSINFFIFDSTMPLMPLDLHCRFPGRTTLGVTSPEERVASYLKKELGEKIQVHHVDLSKKVRSENQLLQNLLSQCLEHEDIASFTDQRLALGMAIKSHLISKTRDSQPNPYRFRATISSAIRTYLRISEWARESESLNRSSEVWVCNGRPFHERIAREISESSGKSVKFYEIGGEGLIPRRWILHDSSPHDHFRHQEEIERHFSESGLNKGQIEDWLVSRRNKSENPFYRKGKSSQLSRLQKPFVVFFSSSEDEVAAISSSWKSSWGDQLTAVKALIQAFDDQDTYSLVVRVHPNQSNKSRRDQNRWKAIEGSGRTTVFSQDSSIDSYELLNEAAAVIVYQSTVGVEAAILKKPLAFLAPTRYDRLIPSPRLEQVPDISNWLKHLLINNDELLEQSYFGALRWINYMVSAGNPWIHLDVQNKRGRTVGFLDGKKLRPNGLVVALTRVYLRLKVLIDSVFTTTSQMRDIT
jgi:hypothetical protein